MRTPLEAIVNTCRDVGWLIIVIVAVGSSSAVAYGESAAAHEGLRPASTADQGATADAPDAGLTTPTAKGAPDELAPAQAVSPSGPSAPSTISDSRPYAPTNESPIDGRSGPQADSPSKAATDDGWAAKVGDWIVAMAVGFGAAYIGALATRRASERAARDTLGAQRLARIEEREAQAQLAREALQRELVFNRDVLTSRSKLMSRVALQSHALVGCFSLSDPLGLTAGQIEALQGLSIFIERYNAVVALLVSAQSAFASEVLEELSRLRETGVKLVDEAARAMPKGNPVAQAS